MELPSEGGAAEACPSNQGHGLLGDASELQPSPLPSAVERKSDEVTRSSDQPQNPFKKRKVAVFLAYVGHGYSVRMAAYNSLNFTRAPFPVLSRPVPPACLLCRSSGDAAQPWVQDHRGGAARGFPQGGRNLRQ